MTFRSRDAVPADALLTDRYLEALLAGDRRGDAPADSALDPAVRQASTRLRRDLVRVHPSFRFEERLAARLAEAARSMRLAAAAGAEGHAATVPFPLGDLSRAVGEEDEQTPGFPRPLLIGGAITSAALSLAGAAFVAWRRTHPAARRRSPMARAIRAVHPGRRPASRIGLV